MKAKSRGQVHILIRVMHLMQPPQQRHAMRDHMLNIDGEIEKDEAQNGIGPEGQSDEVEQAEIELAGIGGREQCRRTDSETRQHHIQHKNAEIDAPTLLPVADFRTPRRMQFRISDHHENGQEHRKPETCLAHIQSPLAKDAC